MNRFLLHIVFFCVLQTVFAQHPIAIKLTQRDGLPDIEFYDMIEDDKGFIWFACNNGLYRYDGREFKNYSHPKKRGLSVFNLRLDDQKRLWCTNVSGQFFYIENDKLHLFFDASKKLKSEKLHSFNFFDNAIVAQKQNLCFKIDVSTKKVTLLDKPKDKKDFYYNNSAEKNDTLFLLRRYSNTEIKYLVKNGFNIHTYAGFNGANNAIIFVKKKKLIYQELFSNKPLERRGIIKNDTQIIQKLPSIDFKHVNLIFHNNNEEWFLTEKGIEVFETKDSLGNLTKMHHYFPTKNVTEVIKDQQNNFWVSTLRNGVFVVPNIHVNTYELKRNIGNVTTIENVNNTHIYFGTTLGWLGIYNIKNKTTNYIQLNTRGSKVRYILHNKQLNDVYLATNLSRGSHIVDVTTEKEKRLGTVPYYGGAKSMIFLKDGSLFSSLVSDHSLLSLSKGKIDKRTLIKLRNKRVYNTFYDTVKEQLYIANVDELVVYDANFNPTFIRHNNQPIFARGITQTNDGTVWVSTFKGGILALKNNKVVKSYTTKNGLLSNQTNYIKSDEDNVWITTENGLQLLNPRTDTFKNLTQKDGIESFNINSIEIIGNTVWYGSNLGLFSFNKTKVFKPEKTINPYFTSITIADSTYAVQPSYKVGYADKRIAIKFNANQFQSVENTKYQYKLSGLRNKWQDVSKGTNEIVFNSLEQGNYTFELRTINGSKTSETKKIQFKIQGVFYKQWWFILLLSLTVIGIIMNYYRSLLKKQAKKRYADLEKQKNEFEKNALKLENLRSQMNPHFVFNALNSIQDYIMNNQKDLAGDYLGKFADLIRMYLDQSAKKEIQLSEEIETLDRYLELEKLRFEDKLIYQLIVDPYVELEEIIIPTMLVQPYVENALKHGLLHKHTKGHLIVKFTLNLEKTYLIVRVIDDGIGRKKAKEIKAKQFRKHQSFATQATQNRLELLNYKQKNKIAIRIEDVNSTSNLGNVGTKVTIRIPIK